LCMLGIGRERLTVPLVGGETREVDEREPDVGGPGELRRSEVADDLAAAALDWTGHGTRVGLEIGELGRVQRVADAQCEHDALLIAGVWPRDARYVHAERFDPARTVESCRTRLRGLVFGESYVMADTDMLSTVAALLGEPARTRILTALFSGRAMTAKELAYFAGVTAATASSHLSRLLAGHLLVMEKQGRCHYY